MKNEFISSKTQTLTYLMITLKISLLAFQTSVLTQYQLTWRTKQGRNNQTHPSAADCEKERFTLCLFRMKRPLASTFPTGSEQKDCWEEKHERSKNRQEWLQSRGAREKEREGAEEGESQPTANSLFHWTTFTAFQQVAAGEWR